MDPKTVEKLETKIEEAIAEIVVKMGVRKLPLLPSRRLSAFQNRQEHGPLTRRDRKWDRATNQRQS